MSWLNEFQFLLFVLIMKVFLFWAVAAWVVAVTADRPCAEYCVYLSSGTRDIEFQPGCDCMNEEIEYQKRIDDSGIYYEPLNYAPLPIYFRNQPFYILNPVIQGHTADNIKAKPNTVQPSLQSRSHDTTIELNVENTHATNNRHEKDIQSNKQRINAPLYLDVDVESDDVERSASTKSFTTEELNLTEQSLLECTNLYSAIHSSKNSDLKNKVKNYLSQEYRDLSNEELEKIIQNKCSHISYIIEESLNEIKKTRSKLTSVMFRMDSENQPNNIRLQHTNNHHTTDNTLCTNVTENNLQSSVVSESKIKEYSDHQEQAAVNYTESDEKLPDNLNSTPNNLNTTPKNFSTLSSEVSSTGTATTSVGVIQYSSDIYITTQDVSGEVSKASIKSQSTTPMPTQNETTSLGTITMTSEASTPLENILAVTSTVKQEVIKEKRTDQEFKTADTPGIEGRSINRPHYQEGEVSLVKIITHEYSNNTVQSFINGTEDIPNGDFNDELKPTEIDQSIPTPAEFETSTPNSEGYGVTAPDISGKLYFYFNRHHVPAKFIQNSNGSIHLGVDGMKLCNSLTQNGDHNSALLTNLCNCYNTGNCEQNDTD